MEFWCVHSDTKPMDFQTVINTAFADSGALREPHRILGGGTPSSSGPVFWISRTYSATPEAEIFGVPNSISPRLGCFEICRRPRGSSANRRTASAKCWIGVLVAVSECDFSAWKATAGGIRYLVACCDDWQVRRNQDGPIFGHGSVEEIGSGKIRAVQPKSISQRKKD